ncbi:MAG: serine/threonine protein kinase [Myxococcales bacterium]|nr:serine/threonine protein kinase [Myxococcales bacterium]
MLDRYELRQSIHSGPGGQVWIAADEQDLPVVVKTASDPEGVVRLAHEACVLRRLDHPNVVRPVTSGEGALVLEAVHGQSLAQRLRGRRLTVQQTVELALQLCAALEHVHGHGVVHRDVKAANVLLGEGEQGVVLVDFGIALVDGEGEKAHRQAGLLGSLHTVSPEQVRGHAVDGRADLYAVGVLLYRMLCGRYPFHASNGAEIIAAHASQQPRPMREHHPGLRLPEGLEALVMRCLAKQPGDRPDSASALALALRQLPELPSTDGAAPHFLGGLMLASSVRWMAGALGIGALLTLAVGWVLA